MKQIKDGFFQTFLYGRRKGKLPVFGPGLYTPKIETHPT